jgi:CheY-like chemotaxis protein
MIVDDHAAFRQVMKNVLAPLAAEFVECRDGQEAVDRYGAAQPDYVLMDIEMKPLDGLRATACLKARFPHARIIILTDYNETGLRDAAGHAGACGYVLKEELPRLQQLIQTHVSQALDAHYHQDPTDES